MRFHLYTRTYILVSIHETNEFVRQSQNMPKIPHLANLHTLKSSKEQLAFYVH